MIYPRLDTVRPGRDQIEYREADIQDWEFVNQAMSSLETGELDYNLNRITDKWVDIEVLTHKEADRGNAEEQWAYQGIDSEESYCSEEHISTSD